MALEKRPPAGAFFDGDSNERAIIGVAGCWARWCIGDAWSWVGCCEAAWRSGGVAEKGCSSTPRYHGLAVYTWLAANRLNADQLLQARLTLCTGRKK
ncbi:hypothetical protein E2C01_092955 [Portunus trituberculatus]|uniref:Uncharacterized protein n=1 Tax=Portunus trituberculatus TaxID=210409 RepID=A0A5B7JHU1_PORTR|nr:hypothetical protein [Portunus trituberculatus]